MEVGLLCNGVTLKEVFPYIGTSRSPTLTGHEICEI